MIEHFINGKKVADHVRTLNVYKPQTGELSNTVACAGVKEVSQAIEAAKKAYSAWSQTSPIKRSQILFKFKMLLEQHIDEIASLVTNEHGKLLDDAKGSVLRGLEVVDYCCGIPALLKGDFSENVATNIDTITMRQSLGVCAGVTPFNFPVMIPIWMFIPAIACGNTFVLKPSEKDPSAPLRLAELMHKAGLPEGVLNIVNGDKEAVDAILNHPDVVAIACVGSTPVAESIYNTAIQNGKRAHCFGGAKNHAIVMSDADLEFSADNIASAAIGSAGERCMALSVALVMEDIADSFVKKVTEKAKQVEMGPLVTDAHRDRVKQYIDIGVKEGAQLVWDGRQLHADKPGFFMGASVFDHVTPSMRIYKEEIFGPVLSIVRVKNFDEALQLINAHEYGNGTAIFTHNGKSAREFASKVKVGMIGINVPIPVPVAFHSFGGWKNSVFGDCRMHGDEGIRFWTEAKTVVVRWP